MHSVLISTVSSSIEKISIRKSLAIFRTSMNPNFIFLGRNEKIMKSKPLVNTLSGVISSFCYLSFRSLSPSVSSRTSIPVDQNIVNY